MPHSIPTTHSNEQKIIQDGRRNLPSILFAKGGTNIYISAKDFAISSPNLM